MNDLVSIITPAYNAEKTISETIDSVLNQTMKDWEMIIVDDCSTDKTVEIVQSYMREDSRTRLIKKEENSGVAAARNIALNEAKGKYIAFLDSDDLWLPEKLDKQISYMHMKKCVLCYSAYRKFDTAGKNKDVKVPAKMKADDVLKNTSIACLTVIIDQDKSGKVQMPLSTHCEDNCTWYSILERTGTEAYGMNEILALYRVGKGSLTSSKINSAKQQWRVYRDYLKFPVIKSIYYYISYAVNASKKNL